jgi:hypothetical protein
MQVEGYVNACCPTPYQVLGVKLRPLTLGHLILLTKVDSPLLQGGSVTLADLALAVMICAERWQAGHELIQRGDLDKFTAKWRKKLGKVDVAAKAKLFRDYLEDHQRMPEVYFTAGHAGDDPGSWWGARFKVLLITKLGLTSAEVFDAPLAMLWWDYLTWMEMEKQVRFKGPADVMRGDMNAALAKFLEERKAAGDTRELSEQVKDFKWPAQ